MPDITILPQLATFFDVTIDELIGYTPQLSKEQIPVVRLERLEPTLEDLFLEVIGK